MTGPRLTPPPAAHPRAPRLRLPPGAVDCHMHLFGPAGRYRVDPQTTWVSADATAETYLALMDRLGIAMGVFIPASPHGTDPAHLLDVLAAHPDRFVGVAILGPDATAAEVARLARAGVKGARFQSAAHGSKLPGFSPRTAAMIHDWGWHVQLFPSGTEIVELAPVIASLPNPVVLDHFAAVPAAGGLDQPAFRTLLRLLDTGRVWVKLSRPSQVTAEEPPYPSVAPFARALAAHAPERLLWGTDWPHVGLFGRTMPDDGALVDLLEAWLPDDAVRRRVLVDNPDAFYQLHGAARRVHEAGR